MDRERPERERKNKERTKRTQNQHNISVSYVCIHIHPTLYTYTTSPVPQCLWSCLLGWGVPGIATRGKTSISCVGKIGWDPSRSSHLSKARSPLWEEENQNITFSRKKIPQENTIRITTTQNLKKITTRRHHKKKKIQTKQTTRVCRKREHQDRHLYLPNPLGGNLSVW